MERRGDKAHGESDDQSNGFRHADMHRRQAARKNTVAANKPANTGNKQPPEKFCNLDDAMLKLALLNRIWRIKTISAPPNEEPIIINLHSASEIVYRSKLIILQVSIPPNRSV